jgi:hypothetical protein
MGPSYGKTISEDLERLANKSFGIIAGLNSPSPPMDTRDLFGIGGPADDFDIELGVFK